MKTFHHLCICLALVAPALAQVPPPQPKPRPQAPPQGLPGGSPERPKPIPRPRGVMRQRPYDIAKEETIKAKVLEVKELIRGPFTMIALMVEANGKEAQIALGTKEYLAEKKIAFAKGDTVTIKGIIGQSRLEIEPAEGHEIPEPRPPREGIRPGGKDNDKAPIAPKAPPTPPPSIKDDAKTTAHAEASAEPQRIRIRVREITKGKQTLKVLENDGSPAWRPRTQQ